MTRKVKGRDFIYVTGKKYDNMMGRCYRLTDSSYSNYGERGIKVCENWLIDISNFRVWVLEELNKIGISVEDFVKDSKYYQLDRIDNNGHYMPNNCRIVVVQTNVRNRRKTLKQVVSSEGNIINFQDENTNLENYKNNLQILKGN